MKQMNVNQIKVQILPILKNAGVTRASLFGSYVRGEQNEQSDIDILVNFPEEKTLFDFIDVKLQLENVLGKKVDLIEYQTIKPQLKTYILSEQLQIL